MMHIYILILNLLLSFKVYNIFYFILCFYNIKIIDALIKIKYSSYKLWYIGGHSVYYRDPIFINPPPPPLIGTGIGESPN